MHQTNSGSGVNMIVPNDLRYCSLSLKLALNIEDLVSLSTLACLHPSNCACKRILLDELKMAKDKLEYLQPRVSIELAVMSHRIVLSTSRLSCAGSAI